MTSTFTCPHCGNTNKVIPQKARSYDGFEHEAPTIVKAREGPVGAVRDLIHFLKGGRASFEPQAEPVTTLRIEEISEDNRHWVLNDLDERITLDDLKTIARYVLAGDEFSRPNSIKRGLSQHKHNLIASELGRLNMVHVTKANRSVLSLRGTALLRQAHDA